MNLIRESVIYRLHSVDTYILNFIVNLELAQHDNTCFDTCFYTNCLCITVGFI